MTVLNSTAVEVIWTLPISGVNGIVRGFKIFADKINGSETIIDVADNKTEVYIISGLEPSSQYLISMLIYTVADGPPGIHLTANMPGSG